MTMSMRRVTGSALRGLPVLVACVLSLAPVPAGAAPAGVDGPGVLLVQTVPAVKGARVAAEGNIAFTDRTGLARLPVARFSGLSERLHVLPTRISEDTRVTLDRIVGRPEHGVSGAPLVVGLHTQRLVTWRFKSRTGHQVLRSDVSLLEMKSNTGEALTLTGADVRRPAWMAASRTQQTPQGLVSKDLYWTVSRVVVDGADVVNRGQQKFVPSETHDWVIDLLFFRADFIGRDLLFGSRTGEGIEMTGPDGRTTRIAFVNGHATAKNLARGMYDVRVYGAGVSFTRPMSVSKDQVAEIEVITRLDLGLIMGVVGLAAISLLVVGRRHLIKGLGARLRTHGAGRRVVAGAVVIAVSAGGFLAGPGEKPAAADAGSSGADPSGAGPPVFAYYYIWYQPTSWLRAKTDYPLIGRYSSDDPVVMRRHVEMAKTAGLTGFLVSWKDTAVLTPRLATLVSIAEDEDFELGIVYQGLDFNRRTQPVDRVAEDLQTLAGRYGNHPVFDHFGKPVVVVTGTEDYSVDQLREMTAGTRDRLHILASAKSSADYARTAPVVDGDAYYWSSADPRSDWYRTHLDDVASAVRADDGLWFAPAAAGFDARLVGGVRVIPRAGGETLATSLEAALTTDPDAIAVISWNEYSENSHVEPSQKYGTQELDVLADALAGRATLPPPFRPGTPAVGNEVGLTGWGALLALVLVGALLNFWMGLRRPDRHTGGSGVPARTARQPDVARARDVTVRAVGQRAVGHRTTHTSKEEVGHER